MKRRDFLRASAAGAPLFTGCTVFEVYREPPECDPTGTVDDPPERVYLPTHRDGMEMVGHDTAGGYEVQFSYTYPHQFWTVTGDRAERVDPTEEDDVHLMVTVEDAETGTPMPIDAGASLEILKDGETVVERGPWLMVSQTMGFHLGDNVPFEGDGEYVARLTLGEPDARTDGPVEGGDGGVAEVEFVYTRDDRDSIDCDEFDREMWGAEDALSPMVDGADVDGVEARADDDSLFVAENDDGYLAVHLLTPYNRFPIPSAELEATVERDGETVFDDRLVPTVDGRGFHYGADAEVRDGDEVRVEVVTPPQVARHAGYQTAFLGRPTVELSL